MKKGDYLFRPVESLQYMLRILSQKDSRLVPVTPDGIYGQNTAAAVTAFQRCHGLPTTGRADPETWDAVVEDYEAARPREDGLPYPGERKPGERSANLNLVQAMLKTCHKTFGSIPNVEVTGVMDAPTVAALRRFQSICGLPVTGTLTEPTWDCLAALHAMAQNLQK